MILVDHSVLSLIGNDDLVVYHLRLREITLLEYLNPECAFFRMSSCLDPEAKGVLGSQAFIIMLVRHNSFFQVLQGELCSLDATHDDPSIVGWGRDLELDLAIVSDVHVGVGAQQGCVKGLCASVVDDHDCVVGHSEIGLARLDLKQCGGAVEAIRHLQGEPLPVGSVVNKEDVLVSQVGLCETEQGL